MASKKISELIEATSTVNGTDAATVLANENPSAVPGPTLFNIVQGGINKKLTTSNLFQHIDTGTNYPVTFNHLQRNLNVVMKGNTDQFLFNSSASLNNIGIGVETPAEKLHINGNLKISDGFLRIASTESAQGQGILGGITLNKAITQITTTGVAQGGATIGAGKHGQIKQFVLVSALGKFTLVIPTAFKPSGYYDNIVFNHVGDTVTLQYICAADNESNNTGKWYVVGSYGVTFENNP